LSRFTTRARPRTWAFSVLAGNHRLGVDAGQLVGNHMGQLAEPEIRHGGQHRALAGNRIGQDHVEGREAIGGDDQQLVLADGIDVAHLAAPQQRQAGDAGLEQQRGGELWA
jgi:hypothetical protein